MEATTRHLNEYGESGLRTLALAYRKVDEQEYSAWNSEFQKAKAAVGSDREETLERLSDAMERDLILVGATAVEDKLQKGVGFYHSLQLICIRYCGSTSANFTLFSLPGAPMH